MNLGHRTLGRKLREGRELGVQRGASLARCRLQRVVDEAGRPVGDRLRGVSACCHVRELPLNQAELTDRATKLPPLCRVLGRDLDGGSSARGAVGGQLEPPHVERAERDQVAFPDLAEQVFDRDVHVFERERGHGRAVLAQKSLVRADGQPVAVRVHDESREVLTVHFGEEDEDVRPCGVGDPLLAPVHHVVCTLVVQHRPRRDVHGVRSRAGFGQGEAREHLSVHTRPEVTFALVLGGEVDERKHADALMSEDQRAEAPEFRADRAHAGDGEHAEVESAVFLGDLRHE